jgi:nicotinamidase-related amidase
MTYRFYLQRTPILLTTLFQDAVIIPSLPGAFTPPERWVGQFIIEKPTYYVQDNPNFYAMLKALGPRRAVVFGVATEYCVLAGALALRRHGLKVDLVIDAIKPITEEGGHKALEEMAAAGVQRVTTAGVCKPIVSLT